MNERISIDFTQKPDTEKPGKRVTDIFGDYKQALDYARLLDEMGYPVHGVTDVYRNETIEWRKASETA